MERERASLFIVEEHHQAFAIWRAARRTKLVTNGPKTLLHVDHHSDLGIPQAFGTSIDTLDNLSIPEIEEWSLVELSIGSFILPAVYLSDFDNVVWLDQEGAFDNDRASRSRSFTIFSEEALGHHDYVRAYIHSRFGHGKELLIGEMQPAVEGIQDSSRKVFTVSRYVLPNFPAHLGHNGWLLDIDLDYFSCTGNPKHATTVKLEVTRQEFERLKGPYHPFCLLKGRPRLVQTEEGYFAELHDPCSSYRSKLTVDEPDIIARINCLIEKLSSLGTRPELISIARSRYSGFTPANQWQFIETELLRGLDKLYDIRLLNPGDLTRPSARNKYGSPGFDSSQLRRSDAP